MSLTSGQVVGQRYRVLDEIATGGMGSVHEVERLEDAAHFAIKVIRGDLVQGGTTLERFRREAQLLSKIDHPGVVQILDAGLLEDQSAFFVMELLEGETLLDYFRREAPMSASDASTIIGGVADALDAVHGLGIIHRDLKPANIILAGETVKLVDFGIAKAADVTRLTMTGQMVGTVRYMAPEQIIGEAVDHRADIYALGVMAWAALAGRPPFPGSGMETAEHVLAGAPRLDEVAPDLGEAICAAVHRAMSREASRRFESAGAFAAAFAEAAVGAPKVTTRPSTGFMPLAATVVDRPRRPPEEAARAAEAPSPGPTTAATATATGHVEEGRTRFGRWIAGGLVAALVLGGIVGILFMQPGFSGESDGSPASADGVALRRVEAAATPDHAAAAARPVRVSSEPSGALVEMDGAVLGNTPIELPMRGAEKYALTLSLGGYEPAQVAIGQGTDEEVLVTLVAAAPGHPSSAMRRRQVEALDPWNHGAADQAPAPDPAPAATPAMSSSGGEVYNPWD
ncbi:MAG: hypothetical protein DRJ42_15315 [Deltaproteobacteria bacterium]|nr:MAG: hypothetical protein DRJ42_15315 [Deltaproteobacteria bacterium]